MAIPTAWLEGDYRTLVIDVTPRPRADTSYNPNSGAHRAPWFQCPDGSLREEDPS